MQTSIMFTILGGDERMRACAEGLRALGHHVADLAQPSLASVTLQLLSTDVLILPLPAFSGTLVSNTEISQDALLHIIPPDIRIFAGVVPDALQGRMIDYNQDEAFQLSGAIATAEGSIELMMRHLPITLYGARCLIIGYGRIGKALSSRLAALGMDVTVSARKESDWAAIREQGLCQERTGVYEHGFDYDCIINTVPAMVLPSEALQRIAKDCLLLDLASKPGGLDWEESRKLNLNAIHALALPGKVAPITSGLAIRDTILDHLNLH